MNHLEIYACADFDKANRLINETDWSFLQDTSSSDPAWDLWEKKVYVYYGRVHHQSHTITTAESPLDEQVD